MLDELFVTESRNLPHIDRSALFRYENKRTLLLSSWKDDAPVRLSLCRVHSITSTGRAQMRVNLPYRTPGKNAGIFAGIQKIVHNLLQ
ncbi:MAG: hypothetical protein LBC14_02265 [Desulfovibrio sp.]|jgi:hypothetical protein|nr:hypothetical protein [Desulfovibrio sp.]